MKKLMLLSVVAFAMVSTMSLAQTPQQAKVKSATVFLNGAQLTQTVSLPLQKGDNEVIIENLSPAINQNSLQVKLGAGVVVSSYEYSIDYLSADKQSRSVKPIADSLKIAQSKLQDLQQKLSTNTEMQELLQLGLNHSMQVEQQNITVETIEKNLGYFQTRFGALQAEKVKTENDISATKELISRLQRQLKQDGMQGARRTGILRLNLNSQKTATIRAEIQYFTPRASWAPSYELRVEKLNAPIKVVMKAKVAQTTGLDWDNVQLTLSTNEPSSTKTAPTFSTWYLRQIEQRRYNKSYAASASKVAMPMMMAMADDLDETAVEEEEAMAESTISNYVKTNEQDLSVEYAIDLPYTILGNGKQQTIALLEKTIDDVNYTYLAAPKLDPTSYLIAEVSDWQKLQLLDGTATVTYEGTFYGETYLQSSTTDQKLQLVLGDDKQVSVKREKVEDFTAKKAVGQEMRVSNGYKITVRNNKSIAVDMVVKEQFPVSSDKQITVSLSDKNTPADNVDNTKGILTYKLHLEPGEAREIMVSYTVKYPKDWQIGL